MFCSICQLGTRERILHWVEMVCDHVYRILATTPVPRLNGAFEGSDCEILWKGPFEEPLEHINYLLVRQILLGTRISWSLNPSASLTSIVITSAFQIWPQFHYLSWVINPYTIWFQQQEHLVSGSPLMGNAQWAEEAWISRMLFHNFSGHSEFSSEWQSLAK